MTTREEAPADLDTRIDALQATVAALEKQIGRAGREQLKANALAETQAERLTAALEALQTAETRSAANLDAARAHAQAAAAEARLEIVRAMFPTVDGLDEAIRAGVATLTHHTRQEPADALLRRLLNNKPDGTIDEAETLRRALRAWLDGLTLVRRRLLDALAAAGVTPIAADGEPFDPRRHVAVEVVPDTAPAGTVLQELRRGFVAGERVLRHAEVAVAGDAHGRAGEDKALRETHPSQRNSFGE